MSYLTILLFIYYTILMKLSLRIWVLDPPLIPKFICFFILNVCLMLYIVDNVLIL